jgi:uncharacterized protein with PIN domain
MAERRFLADAMLGSLARWLRIMGHDTVYARDVNDDQILVRARAEGRTVLTRDRQLAERAGGEGMFVRSDDPAEQLEEVVRRYGLRFDEGATRCTRCNGVLLPRAPEEVGDRVPPLVRERQDAFLQCSSCGQIYWKGTHWERIVAQVGAALDKARCGSSPR